MPNIGPILAASGNLSLMYAERLLKGVPAEQFARFAAPGGKPIQSNHPAFVFGHLSLYPARVMEQLGLPAGDAAVPAEYAELFKPGAECQDDEAGDIYPSMDELNAAFFDGYRAAIAAVTAAPDEKFLEANPAEGRMKELFPTRGAALAFYLGGHMQNHLGQMSVWRRAIGLGAA